MLNDVAQAGLRHVVVVGTGGNIGSHLVPHLARMPSIDRLTLIDPDVYEQRNLRNQSIAGWAVDQNKAYVQAHVAHGINPGLHISVCAERVEDLPLGLLRADLILACVDSRRTRQYLNEAAWRLNVPWLDAGVLAEGLLARLDLYIPAPDAPCLECGWDSSDYQAIEQRYACAVGPSAAPATDAPSALGALAAALQALECERLLAQQTFAGALAGGDQVVLAVAHHRHYRTAHQRNAHCRLDGHKTWVITQLPVRPEADTLGTLLDLISARFGARRDLTLSIAGKPFVRGLTCQRCDISRATLCLVNSAPARRTRCEQCNQLMLVTGFALSESLHAAALSESECQLTLATLGIRAHEIITVACGSVRLHIELCPPAAPQSSHQYAMLGGTS